MGSSCQKSLLLGTTACLLALAGCSPAEDTTPGAGTGAGAGATSGAGAVGGMTGGSAGTNPAAGAGAMGGTTGGDGIVMSGGMSGGSSGTTGGTAGEPPDLTCETEDDIKTGKECAEEAEGWFAIKTVIDVWWVGTPVRDPGRGNIEVYLLGKIENVCPDGSNGLGTIKACGTVLPPFTSDVACDAFQIEFPNELWDSPMMPRFTTTGSTTAFEAGGILTLASATGLLGIDLMDDAIDGTFPTSAMTGMFPCEAGMGADCFPDHDNDGEPGISIRLRSDGATYAGPAYSPNCTNANMPYKYRGSPTTADLGAGGGAGGGVRAVTVRIGLRTRLGGAGEIAAGCMSGVGDSSAEFLDSRALECLVDPTSLPTTDPRVASMDYSCSPSEAQFVDDNTPSYLVLAKDEVPGDAMVPLGWTLATRDIPKTASAGTRSALVRLGDSTMAEPACADVRDATFPEL